MSSVGAAPRAAVPVSNARAEASRRNGAKSRGPKTSEGALGAKCPEARPAGAEVRRAAGRGCRRVRRARGGACARAGATGRLVKDPGRAHRARRMALDRAERLQVELFAERLLAVPDGGPGLALIRDGNGTRSFETLLRYRGAAQAEFMRSLRMLKALQAEQAGRPVRPAALGKARAPGALLRPAAIAPILAAAAIDRPASHHSSPIEPESCRNARKSAPPNDRASPSGSNPRPAPVRPLPTPVPGRPAVQRSAPR
jgi:hypothetical protein